MFKRTVSALVVASLLSLSAGAGPAFAENQMGYQMLSASQATALPRAGGSIGINVGPAQEITDSGLSFRLLRVNSVKPGSPGAQAGFKAGDQIIAVDGRVFPGVPAFANYIAAQQPGRVVNVDFMPSNGGPENAQRAALTIGSSGTGVVPAPMAQPDPAPQTEGTLSTGSKVAIGAAAVALFGCYKLGCFSGLKKRMGTGLRQPAVR